MYASIRQFKWAVFLGLVNIPSMAHAHFPTMDSKTEKAYFTVSQIELQEFDAENMLSIAPMKVQVLSGEIDWNVGAPNPNPHPITAPSTSPSTSPSTLPSVPPAPSSVPSPVPAVSPAPIPSPHPTGTAVPGFSSDGNTPTYPPTYTPAPAITGTDWDISSMVAFGKQTWEMIVSNKPVVNVKTDKIDVLPEGTRGWVDLQGWNPPKIRAYKLTFRNALGLPIINVEYQIMFTNGGNKDGRGSFLSNVTVIPTNIFVFWGFEFSMNASIANVTNAGSWANPMAAVELLVQWKTSTPLIYRQGSYSYYVRGDGYFQEL